MELCSVAYNPTVEPGMCGMPGMYQSSEVDQCCTAACPPYEEPTMQGHCPKPMPVPEPIPAHVEYVVKKGDSVYKIAKQYGTTMQAIILGNNLRTPNLIYPGQILIIPGV